MKYSSVRRHAACLLALSLLAACASNDGGGNWSSLGEANNGNIRTYIDKSSIQRNGNLVTFRDKKTVVNPREERFTNTPPYKTALGNWEFDCRNRTYRLTELTLLDNNGQQVSQQRYSAADLRPMQIMGGSLTEKQFEAVCSSR